MAVVTQTNISGRGYDALYDRKAMCGFSQDVLVSAFLSLLSLVSELLLVLSLSLISPWAKQ